MLIVKAIAMRDTQGDLRGGQVGDWLVTGWFTPDNRPLATEFAAQLARHNAPYHLWAMPSAGWWDTLRKPAVVRETLNSYPGKTVVLMDVDCVVKGDIAPVTHVDGDVGIIVIARNQGKGRRLRHWIRAECSSRVVVFRPTDGARAFIRKWAETIERSAFKHDEHSMVWAMLSSLPSTRFDFIDQRYSGREIGTLPDAVIAHDGAHDEERRLSRGSVNLALRALERRFLRTGRTRQGRLQSILLKAE